MKVYVITKVWLDVLGWPIGQVMIEKVIGDKKDAEAYVKWMNDQKLQIRMHRWESKEVEFEGYTYD